MRKDHKMLAAFWVLLLVSTGCRGGRPDVRQTAGTPPADGTETTLSVEAKKTGERYEFVTPPSVAAGVHTVTFKNSTGEAHEAQFVRVEGERTIEEVLAIIQSENSVQPIPDWLTAQGGVFSTAPGKSRSTTLTLRQGTHYLFDTRSPEAGTSGPVGAPVVSYARQGLATRIDVVPGDETGRMPETDLKIVAREYTFELPELKPGVNRISFENAGREIHHIIGFPILPGKTADDARNALLAQATGSAPEGPPPVDFRASDGVAVMDSGQTQVTQLELKEGNYLFVCFIADRAGGPSHAAKGMTVEKTIS